jgi:hypothetical protein
MNTISVVRLKRCQTAQLLTHLSAYRSYLWQTVLPSPERNHVVRTIQEVQVRCEPWQTQGQEYVALTLSREEGSTLKLLLGEVNKLYGTLPASAKRNQAISEVTALRLLIYQTFRQTQAL